MTDKNSGLIVPDGEEILNKPDMATENVPSGGLVVPEGEEEFDFSDVIEDATTGQEPEIKEPRPTPSLMLENWIDNMSVKDREIPEIKDDDQFNWGEEITTGTDASRFDMTTEEGMWDVQEDSPELWEEMFGSGPGSAGFGAEYKGTKPEAIAQASIMDASLKEKNLSNAQIFTLDDSDFEDIVFKANKAKNGEGWVDAAEKLSSVKAQALHREVNKTTGLKPQVDSAIARIRSNTEFEGQDESKITNAALNSVMNERMMSGIKRLSPQDQKLWQLQERQKTLLSKMSGAMSSEDRIKVVNEQSEIDNNIQELRSGAPLLFNYEANKFVSADEDSEEVEQAMESNQRKEASKIQYANNDMSSVLRSWNNLYSNFNYINDILPNEKTISHNGELYSIKELTDNPSLLIKQQERYDGLLIPDKSMQIFEPNELGRVYTANKAAYNEKLKSSREKFDAVNEFLMLNKDPAQIEKSFFPLLGEAFSEALGIDIQSDADKIDNYVRGLQETGGKLTPEQISAAKDDLSDKVAKGLGASIPAMVELAVTSYLTGGAASISSVRKARAVIRMYMKAKGGRTGKFMYNVIEGQIGGAIAYGIAPSNNITIATGIGEGGVQGALNSLNPEKFFSKSKYGKLFSILSRTAVGGTAETIQEYAGEFVDNLSNSKMSWEEAFKETFGRNPEDAMDKLAVTAIISFGLSGAFNIGLGARARTEIEASNSPNKEQLIQMIDEAEANSPKVEAEAEAEVSQEDKITSVTDKIKKGEEMSEEDLQTQANLPVEVEEALKESQKLADQAKAEQTEETQATEETVEETTTAAETEIQEELPVVKEVTEEKVSTKFIEKPLSEINTDTGRFQNRTELDQGQVDKMSKNWDESQLDPIVLWKDESGKDFLLAGHHRLAAAENIGKKDITSKYFEGTEAEAIEYATQKSNANRTMEADFDRAKIYSKMREEGKSKKEINEALTQEGRNKVYINNISHLNPSGKSIDALKTFSKAGDRTTQKVIERAADFVGAARKNNPGLTNAHENEMFDYLYGGKGKGIASRSEFLDLVNRRVNGFNEFNTNEPLNFEHKVGRGSNEMDVINDIKDLKRKKSDYDKELKEAQKLPNSQKELRDRKVARLTQDLIRTNQEIGDMEKTRRKAVEGDKLQTDIFSQIKEEVNNKTIDNETVKRFENSEEQNQSRIEPTIKDIESKVESSERATEEELKSVINDADDLFSSEKPSIKDKRKERIEAADAKIAEGMDEFLSAMGGIKQVSGKESPNAVKALQKVAEGLVDKGFIKVEDIIRELKKSLDNKWHKFIDDNIDEITTKPKTKKPSKGKKSLLNRAYEGTSDIDTKESIEKLGLDYETESWVSAKKKSKDFINEVGIDNALEAVRKNLIEDGAQAFIWADIIDSVGDRKEMAETVEEQAEWSQKEAELLEEFDRKVRSGGRFISALQDVYKNSDFGYSAERRIKDYKDNNGGDIPAEVEARLREADKMLKEIKGKLAEAEQRATKAEEDLLIENIKEASKRKKKKSEPETPSPKGKNLIAEGMQDLAQALGTIQMVHGTKRPDVALALAKIGKGLIDEGIATADNVADKIKEYIEKNLKGKVDFDKHKKKVAKTLKSWSEDVTEGKIKIPGSVIRDFVERGVDNIEDLTEAVKKFMADEYPNATSRQIRDAITGYGKTSNLSKDEISVQIRKMNRIGQLISKLQDVKAGKRPLRSGVQRDKVSTKERDMQRNLKELMKDLPLDEADLETELKTSLDAIKTRLKNSIESLEARLKGGPKPEASRTVEYDAEAKALKKQRDDLQSILNELEPKTEITKEEMIKRSVKSLEKSISEQERRIREKDLYPEDKKPFDSPELKPLRDKLTELKDEIERLKKVDNPPKSPAEIATLSAIKRVESQTESLQSRIEKKELVLAKKESLVQDTADLKAAKEALSKQKEILTSMQKEAGIPEATRLSNAKKRAAKRIEELKDKLKAKDYVIKKPKPIFADSELNQLKAEKEKWQEAMDKERIKLDLKNRGILEKLSDVGLELFSSLWRTLAASIDGSAVFVQGLLPTVRHPKLFPKNMSEMFKQLASEKYHEEVVNKIKSQEWYPNMKAAGLDITEVGGKYSVREEMFVSNWVDFIWDAPANLLDKAMGNTDSKVSTFWKKANPYKASGRAFVGYMNSMRILRYFDGVKHLNQMGETFESNPEAHKAWADYVNNVTGRGGLGPLESSAKALSMVFFSPRKLMSGINLLTPYSLIYFGKMPKAIRQKAIMDYASSLAIMVSIAVMWQAASKGGDNDDDWELFWDPTSSDFLKPKMGNTRIDLFRGLQQNVVTMARMITGQFTSSSGEVNQLGDRYGKDINTRWDVLGKYFSNKFTPSLSFAKKALNQKEGIEVDWIDESTKQALPIWARDVNELYDEHPTQIAIMLHILTIFGGGVNTYATKEMTEEEKEKFQRKLKVQEKMRELSDKHPDWEKKKLKEEADFLVN